MAKPRHLPHAPITEALIDIQVIPRDGLTFTALKDAIETTNFGYYIKSPISEGTFAFALAPEGKPQSAAQATQVGLRLHSSNEKFVAQFRLAGFTLSRLPPYEKWENLLEEAKRLWAIYADTLAPKHVLRVGTRFINNLNLPLETGESFQKYLNKLVDVPDDVPQVVETFFQRFHLVEPASGARVILTLALDGIPPAGGIPVILDVDAFVATTLKPADRDLWTVLERLHELKIRSFFGTITEQTAELYQ